MPFIMVGTIRSWLVLAAYVMRYVGCRMGLAARPETRPYPEGMTVFEGLMRWRTRLRIVHGERCPVGTPAVFAGNHIKLDDPFVMFAASYYATQGRVRLHVMMRDDFFARAPRVVRWIDIDQLAEWGGAIRISRANVQITQLKPFVTLLESGGAFLMFNGRSRTRSGTFFEYRDDIVEPGGVALFMVHAQRRRGDTPVPAVPLARTFNPATKRSTVIFGEPMCLTWPAPRAAQRAFDLELAVRMGDLVEINASQILSAMLYLGCLHGQPDVVPVQVLRDRAAWVIAGLPGRYVDPLAREDLDGELRCTLRYLAKRGVVRLRGETVVVDRGRVLSSPPLDSAYKKRNPVKYLASQILHLGDVVRRIETAVLDAIPPAPETETSVSRAD